MGFKVGNTVGKGANSLFGVTRGRVHSRFNSQRKTYRLRFNGVHPDQIETIFQALEVAREEAGTQYDTVALDMIALEFLATRPGKRPVKSPVNSSAKPGATIQAATSVHTSAKLEKPKQVASAAKARARRPPKRGSPKKRRIEMSPEMLEQLKPLKSEEEWQEERRKLGYEKINGKIRLLR